MDERHWWISLKLSQSFNHFIYYKQNAVEEFISKEETINAINELFSKNGAKILFFYISKNEANQDEIDIKICPGDVKSMQKLVKQAMKSVYFMRKSTQEEVKIETFDNQLFFGEINQKPLALFYDVFRNALKLVSKEKEDFKSSEKNDGLNQYLSEMENHLQLFSEYKDMTLIPTEILKIPKNHSVFDFKKNRMTSLSPQLVSEHEQIVTEWIISIENVLKGSLEERHDFQAGNLVSMLTEWKRKFKLVRSIIEQLKGKDCKAILAVLIAGKSKLLKNWKNVDSLLTDISNDVKEKVKYLESFGKRFEQLQFETDLSRLLNSAIPDFLSHVRQLDIISKFYAKNGFLGLIFAKVSYQIYVHCKENLNTVMHQYKTDTDSPKENLFWALLNKENQNEKSCKKRIKTSNGVSNLVDILNLCLSVCKQYRKMYFGLIDSLGGRHNLQHIPENSGIYLFLKKIHRQGGLLKVQNNAGATPSVMVVNDAMSSTESNEFTNDNDAQNKNNQGIPIMEVSIIMKQIDLLTERIQAIVDIRDTVKQFTLLSRLTKGLPQLSEGQWNNTQSSNKQDDDDTTISEIEAVMDEECYSAESEEEMEVFYESLSTKIKDVLRLVSNHLCSSLTWEVFIDFERSEKFNSIFVTYLQSIEQLQATVSVYIKEILTAKWTTQQQINILQKFHPVLYRNGLLEIFQEKYTIILQLFQLDLEKVEEEYELQKEQPPTFRNTPIVSSAIYWSKNLYHRIERPMKELKEIKLIHQLKGYDSIVKYFNQIATILIRYEGNWLNIWESQVSNCLSYLNNTLLAYEVNSKRIIVFAEPRVLEIFADVKLLKQVGAKIPKVVQELCSQELKFKKYQQILEDLVRQYYKIYDNIPNQLEEVMTPLCKATFSYFQPGLSVLKWDSVNVDAFLFKVQNAIDNLEEVSEKIQNNYVRETNDHLLSIKNIDIFNDSFYGVWNVDEFKNIFTPALISVAAQMNVLIGKIRRILQDIVQETLPKEKKNANHVLLKQSNLEHYTSSLVSPKLARQTPQSPHAMSNERKVLDGLYMFYSTYIFEVVKYCINNGLLMFYNALKNEDPSQSITFKVYGNFGIPVMDFTPNLKDVETLIFQVIDDVVSISQEVYWWDSSDKRTFFDQLSCDTDLVENINTIKAFIKDAPTIIGEKMINFESFSFLWRDDMNALYKEFEEEYGELDYHHQEVKRLVEIEGKIKTIESEIKVNAIVVNTIPVKDSLIAFCVAWKLCYVQKIHQVAQENLEEIVSQRKLYHSHLTCDIASLNDLENVLNEIDNINDVNNHIDEIYLPIETVYKTLLNDYQIPLQREEIETVTKLRDEWANLVLLGDQVFQNVMRQRRAIFEQQLDKEVQEFVVEVIQFRNKFDSQGPGIPGISPNEAVLQLKEFQIKFDEFDQKRRTLHAVQKLFGIKPTPFDELRKTGEELILLDQLYDIFQKYLTTDEQFGEMLWADVDLGQTHIKVKELWDSCSKLPATVHNWYAYKELKEFLTNYLDIFPILQQLASKEIRNRHWLQVMHVTKKSFQLEANIFKLKHILDIGLTQHKANILAILKSSQAELTLEKKLDKIEEEWSEQVFKFDRYKGRGNVIFEKGNMNRIMQVLEDGKISLTSMFSSKHVKPFREEAASWTVKLNEISGVIEQWTAVEELWLNLESIFTTNGVAKDLPQQFATFSKADRSYMKLMKKANENPNVMQCCLASDVSKVAVLKDVQKDLEICFKSLTSYLNQKRKSSGGPIVLPNSWNSGEDRTSFNFTFSATAEVVERFLKTMFELMFSKMT